MKLRNLLFATMFAVAFVGCSNDDDPIVTPPAGDGDAELSVLVAKPQAIESKAAADGGIVSLEVFVFDALNKLEAVGTIATEHVGPYQPEAGKILSSCMKVKAGTKSVIVLANTPEAVLDEISTVGTTTLNDLLTYEYEGLQVPTEAAPLMLNSKLYNVSVKAAKHNLIGFTDTEAAAIENSEIIEKPLIALYRNVAKVTLANVIVTSDEYASAQLKIDSIYVVRGSSKTLIAATDLWGRTEANEVPYLYGDNQANYEYWAAQHGATPYIANWEVAKPADFIQLPAYNFNAAIGAPIVSTAADQGKLGQAFTFYAYENTDNANRTVISIKGTFSYEVAGTRVYEYDQFYNIPIGGAGTVWPTGTDFPGDKNGVMRNLEYTITPTIKGTGTGSPIDPPPGSKEAYLDVQVKVVEYGKVTQTPEF